MVQHEPNSRYHGVESGLQDVLWNGWISGCGPKRTEGMRRRGAGWGCPAGRSPRASESARSQPRPRHAATRHIAHASITMDLICRHARRVSLSCGGHPIQCSCWRPAPGPGCGFTGSRDLSDSFHVLVSNPWAVFPGSLSLVHRPELKGTGKIPLFRLQVGGLRCFGSRLRGAVGTPG